MASGVQLLLRLSPAIRQEVLSSGTLWNSSSSNNICRSGQHISFGPMSFQRSRSFTLSSFLAKKKQNVFKNAQPQKPTPQARNLPKGTPPAAKFTPRSAPSMPNALPTQSSSTPEQVLLYVSPNHGGFFALSFFCGFLFLLTAYTQSQLFLKDEEGKPAIPWSMKALGAVPILGFTAFGTTFVLAPLKVIKSVTLVKAAGASTVTRGSKLRIEIKRVLPFSKPDILEVDPSKFLLDRHIPGSVQNIRFTNHDIKDTKEFNEYYFSGNLSKKEGSAFKRFNAGLLNSWPGLIKNAKRMFLRDQMAYVRVPGNGHFKLDLQGCHMLDRGNVLASVARKDVNVDRGIRGLIKNFTGVQEHLITTV
ncbi:hypothetical protein AC578_8217 [Pseudocercospora eumusae]|uniref:Uncharacterized protein n=1 Tax=Pseudocercospora eumusae TaxID=321146 RepID=A0A139HE69_9PEZI|nr:hypothetical protein AC578_8217 [Pseudocercospora eumusae]